MRGGTFLILALVVMAVDVLVPYLILADVASFAGSFFFWSVLTLLIILSAAWHIRHWGEE
ncbi:MAG: hypothetical protein GVY23_01575 [Spirochaetes bacterium]|nr:hypothetical protein [Spirochaetota bacterium]